MKLYRPPIPAKVKVQVAARQITELAPKLGASVLYGLSLYPLANTIGRPRPRGLGWGHCLDRLLGQLANLLDCERSELRLDHNPALGLRKRRRTGQTIMVGGEPVDVLIYTPPASDPDHLLFRSNHAHHIKTNVRGDGAQFSDTTLMKRERLRKKKARKRKHSGQFNGIVKAIPRRANPWGPKGTRKIRNRPWPKKNTRPTSPRSPAPT